MKPELERLARLLVQHNVSLVVIDEAQLLRQRQRHRPGSTRQPAAVRLFAANDSPNRGGKSIPLHLLGERHV